MSVFRPLNMIFEKVRFSRRRYSWWRFKILKNPIKKYKNAKFSTCKNMIFQPSSRKIRIADCAVLVQNHVFYHFVQLERILISSRGFSTVYLRTPCLMVVEISGFFSQKHDFDDFLNFPLKYLKTSICNFSCFFNTHWHNSLSSIS